MKRTIAKFGFKKLLSLFALAMPLSLIAPYILAGGFHAFAQDMSGFGDIKGIMSLVAAVEDLLNRLLWPILLMIGGLLDNSILFGAGMEARMREIWIPIRNLVNILFVVGLVGVALYNVTGLADEGSSMSLKSALPRIIAGIIVINFSFVGIKVFLDVVNVVTVSIMALPDQVSEGMAEIEVTKDEESMKRFCLAIAGKKKGDPEWYSEQLLKDNTEIIIYRKAGKLFDLTFEGKTVTEITTQANQMTEQRQNDFYKTVNAYRDGNLCNGFSLSDTGKKFLAGYNEHNASLALALNMGEIIYYRDVDISIDNIEKMLTGIFFSILLYLIYAVSFVVLFAVLLVRLVVLWLAIVISPVLIIVMALPALKDKVDIFNTISENFIKHALAPIAIALSMTIGWIMLKAMKSVDSIGSGTVLSEVFDGINTGIPVVGLSTLQDFIVGIGVVAVVWMGVFGAASKTMAKAFTDRLQSGLQSVGGWIAKRPLEAKFIPIRLGEGETVDFSLGDLDRTFRQMNVESGDKSRRLAEAIMGVKTPPRFNEIVNKQNATLEDFGAYLTETKETGATVYTNLKNLQLQNSALYDQIQASAALKPKLEKLMRATSDEDKQTALAEFQAQARAEGLEFRAERATSPTPAGDGAPARTPEQKRADIADKFALGNKNGIEALLIAMEAGPVPQAQITDAGFANPTDAANKLRQHIEREYGANAARYIERIIKAT